MSALKLLSDIVRPSAGDRSLLPAALAAALLVVAVTQLALPVEDHLPVGNGMLIAPKAPERAVGRATVDPILLADPLFARSRGTLATNVATGGPLGGAVPVGVTRTRAGTRVILAGGDGHPVSLAIGQDYNGWRVAGVAADAVRFSRDGKIITVALSDGAVPTNGDDTSQVADER